MRISAILLGLLLLSPAEAGPRAKKAPPAVDDALAKDDVAALARLLDAGTPVDAVIRDMPLLTRAAFMKAPKSLTLLLERGAKPPPDLLHQAAEHADVETLKVLLERKPNLEDAANKRATPFAHALHSYREGREPVLMALLEAGAKWDVQNPNYTGTTLVIAASKGYEKLFADVLARGGKARLGQDGPAALGAASRSGSAAIVKLLLDAGVSPDSADPDNFSTPPLVLAARHGKLEVVKLLAEKTKNIDVEFAGATPLMNAAENGHVAVVEQLIAQGADVSRRSKLGTTARSVAEGAGQTEVGIVLARHDKQPAADPASTYDALIWGGGRSGTEAMKWLEQWNTEAPQFRDLVVPANGLPKIVKSDDMPGMNPGFQVVLLGVCASKDTRAAMNALKAVAERVYARRLKGAVAPSCPVLPKNRARLAFEVVGADKRLHGSLWPQPRDEGDQLLLVLRDKAGALLDLVKVDGLTGCDAELRTTKAGLEVEWGCEEPMCHRPSFKKVTARIKGEKIDVTAESDTGHWDPSCGE